jgi:hypothetical protein
MRRDGTALVPHRPIGRNHQPREALNEQPKYTHLGPRSRWKAKLRRPVFFWITRRPISSHETTASCGVEVHGARIEISRTDPRLSASWRSAGSIIP